MLHQPFIAAILVAIFVTFIYGERVGQGKTNLDEEWSYLWYENEPFMLYCNSSELNVQESDFIMWEKPSLDGNTLKFEKTHDDDNYKTVELHGVAGFQLHIKKLTSETSGVFVCRVHDSSGVSRAQSIVGINIRDQLYDDNFDKYRSHFIVAIIATAVFVVPLATICIVYHCRYERRMDTKMAYAYNGRGREMTHPDGLAEKKRQPIDGAYENPTFSDSSTTLEQVEHL